MSTNRGMDKEDAVHIFNGMLLSHKKEQNRVICRDMDGSIDRKRKLESRKMAEMILFSAKQK